MVSAAALAVAYGFSVLLICYPQLPGAVTMAEASQWGLERLAAIALIPAVLATLLLTPLLSFALVHALRRDGSAGGSRRRPLVTVLAKATVLAATVALVACVVLQQIGADGHLDRGRGDVARLNIK